MFELTANPFKPVKGSGLDRYYSEKNHTTDMAFTSQDAFKGEVQLNNVTFAYPQEPQHIVLYEKAATMPPFLTSKKPIRRWAFCL